MLKSVSNVSILIDGGNITFLLFSQCHAMPVHGQCGHLVSLYLSCFVTLLACLLIILVVALLFILMCVTFLILILSSSMCSPFYKYLFGHLVINTCCHLVEFCYYVVTLSWILVVAVTLLYSGGKQKALSAMVSWLHTGTPALATSDWLTSAASTDTRVQAVISLLGLHQYFSSADGDIANIISPLFNSFLLHPFINLKEL